jgi:catechol-2,3-dioxygenase
MKSFTDGLPMILLLLLAMAVIQTTCFVQSYPSSQILLRRQIEMHAREDEASDTANISLEKSAWLSHAMLKVHSVEDAVSYWKNKGGEVLQSRKGEDGQYQTAFVALGDGKTTEGCFSLELVQTKNFRLGNVINYIGVSLLLQFQNNLEGLIAGNDKAEDEGIEPNGIPIQSCASSPGDFLCRLCLKSNDLEATQLFYTDILGMEIAAQDESQLCLRYQGYDKSKGVPITLVFEGTNEKLDHGTCLDHISVKVNTTVSINSLYHHFKEALSSSSSSSSQSASIYMTPTEMFGMTVIGLRDPNGYKIVIAGSA